MLPSILEGGGGGDRREGIDHKQGPCECGAKSAVPSPMVAMAGCHKHSLQKNKPWQLRQCEQKGKQLRRKQIKINRMATKIETTKQRGENTKEIERKKPPVMEGKTHSHGRLERAEAKEIPCCFTQFRTIFSPQLRISSTTWVSYGDQKIKRIHSGTLLDDHAALL